MMQLLELELLGQIVAVSGGYIRRGGRAMMMDILMYLFETYIHSDAELQVNQDELEEESIRCWFSSKRHI